MTFLINVGCRNFRILTVDSISWKSSTRFTVLTKIEKEKERGRDGDAATAKGNA